MSDTTTTELAKTSTDDIDYDVKIAEAAAEIATLADTLDEALGIKVMDLALLTSPGIKGMESDHRPKIPQVYLRQPSSNSEVIPEDCKIGHLYDSNGTNLGESMTVIPVLLHDLRKKWGEDVLDCQSLDGALGTRYGACSSCPYGRYEPGVRPECSKGFSFYVVTEDLTAFYRIDFLKSSAKAGRNIKRLIQPPALWGRSFKITTEKKAAQNRNYYEFKTQATGTRTDMETMKVCDALHGFFQAQYYGALQGQARYALSLKESADAPDASGAIKVEGESDAIDFSDNM